MPFISLLCEFTFIFHAQIVFKLIVYKEKKAISLNIANQPVYLFIYYFIFYLFIYLFIYFLLIYLFIYLF